MVRSLILFIAGIATASMQQTTNPAAEAARVQDVYAVYSALMANPPVIGGDANKTYAIAAMTFPANLEPAIPPGTPANIVPLMKRCEAPPPGYEDRWQEILADFHSRSDARVPLQRELKIAKPYILLSTDEIAAFGSAHNEINSPLVPNPQFGGAMAVISLSNVYFNKDRTLAAVRISSWCGTVCSQSQRQVLEKTPTGWKDVTDGTGCIAEQ